MKKEKISLYDYIQENQDLHYLLVEWDYEKNDISPKDIYYNSGKRIWWKCSKGKLSEHSWDAILFSRVRGSGCPFCANQRVCLDNCLFTKYPDIAKMWHPTKNSNLTPKNVTAGSGQKVWWLCDKGVLSVHEWETTISSLVNGTSCPYCSTPARRVCMDNCLETVNPDLAKQWHPTKNGNLTPKDVIAGSGQKVWWLCDNGVLSVHEWESTIDSRSKNVNCPYCTGRKVCLDNCLATNRPQLIDEWDFEKNKKTPYDFTTHSNQKIWWICSKGHKWESHINSRSKDVGCPTCIRILKTSFPEQSVFYYLSKVFKDTKNTYYFQNKNKKIEVDIYIPSLKIAIEYDGVYYHKNKMDVDKLKNKFLRKKGIQLIRIRENELPSVRDFDAIEFRCIFNQTSTLNKAVKDILEYIDNNYFLNKDLKSGISKIIENINIENDRFKIKDLVEQINVKDSLKENFPELVTEWDVKRNGKLKPENVSGGSHFKVWWICGKKHEWEARISSRALDGNGCPYCAGQKVCLDNCLETIYPNLAKEWHPTKNGELTPKDVTTAFSRKKIWWKCDKGILCEHEWETKVSNRTLLNRGCPYCTNHTVCLDNCLETIYPNLAKEWHPIKNGSLTPKDVFSKANKKVWWLCDKGALSIHEWESAIYSRASGGGCPYCSGKRACSDNCLETIYPDLAKEWHPTKNEDKTPKDITSGSSQKIWWRCQNGHEKFETIKNRLKRRHRCIECSEMK